MSSEKLVIIKSKKSYDQQKLVQLLPSKSYILVNTENMVEGVKIYYQDIFGNKQEDIAFRDFDEAKEIKGGVQLKFFNSTEEKLSEIPIIPHETGVLALLVDQEKEVKEIHLLIEDNNDILLNYVRDNIVG